ncbi:MAG: hypothetical protein P8077_09860 [Gammaproteobacteria bacterium]
MSHTLLHIINDADALDAFQRHTRSAINKNSNITHHILLIESAVHLINLHNKYEPNPPHNPQSSTPQTSPSSIGVHCAWYYLLDPELLEPQALQTGPLQTGQSNGADHLIDKSAMINPSFTHIEPINYAQFVTLCLNCDRSISW